MRGDDSLTKVAITTFDNPYDPIDDFVHWMIYDEQYGYHTSSYLGRIVKLNDEMTQDEENAEVERAVDEIIFNDFRNIYKKVVKEEKNIA